MLTNVDFLHQMAFRGKINYRFGKSAPDFLLVILYNYWCILRNYQVIQHFSDIFVLAGISTLEQFWGILTSKR